MSTNRDYGARAPALGLLFSLVVGYSLSKVVTIPSLPALGCALFLATIAFSQAKRQPVVWASCFLIASVVSAWAYASTRLPESPDPLMYQLPTREAAVEMKVDRVLQARDPFGRASGIGQIREASPTSRLKPGDRIHFQVSLSESESLLRGSEISMVGLLVAIDPMVESRSFQSYLREQGIHYTLSRSHTFREIRGPLPLASFRQRMNEQFQKYLKLGAPHHGDLERIYVAMLLGQKAELTREQKDRFRLSGTMHFFAISGLHIGVIATVIAQALALMRVPRLVSPFIGLPLLYLYVEITGAPPSAVRAFLMALFFWLSFALSRQRSPLAALAASAVFVLLVAPQQLWSLGFQLSYTVVLSILLFGIPLSRFLSDRMEPFSFLPKEDWSLWQRGVARLHDALIMIFAVSASAWLASAPLSAAFFGYFSPAAIILNILLVNMVAVAITTGVIVLTVSLIGATDLAEFLNYAAWLTITGMDYLALITNRLPGSVVHTPEFSQGVAYATILIFFATLFYLRKPNKEGKHSTLRFVLPPLIVVFLLLFGR